MKGIGAIEGKSVNIRDDGGRKIMIRKRRVQKIHKTYDDNQFDKQCRCGGTNENCQFCFGRGWINVDNSNNRTQTTVRPKKGRLSPTLAAKQPENSALTRDEQPTPLERFYARYGRSPEKDQTPLLVPSPALINMAVCSICGKPVKEKRLKLHMKKVHPKAKSQFSKTNDKKNVYMPNDVSLDGGKYLGYMQRESNGRFGSMPLYDNYGEESSAD